MKSFKFSNCIILLENEVKAETYFTSEKSFGVVVSIGEHNYNFFSANGKWFFNSNNRIFRDIMPFNYGIYLEMKDLLPKEIFILKE